VVEEKVVVENVSKRFGRTVAVNGISFKVMKGEFLTLLGPSGCGKTTTLRLVAGFYKPDEGSIIIDGKVMNDIPVYKRNIGIVFQNYALFPHMTVFENVAFGLRMRKLPENEIRRRVRSMLETVGLAGMEERYPRQLSGGQQQRVALARALVIEPDVLLLDEPLSNLDLKLRLQMRKEIRRIQKRLGITAIYVTHDQGEALSMSDRVAVMNRGRIIQMGTPTEIYERPADSFVADFIGEANLIEGRVEIVEGVRVGIRIGDTLLETVENHLRLRVGDEVFVVARPERIRPSKEGIEATVEDAEFLGQIRRYYLRLTGLEATIKMDLVNYVGESLEIGQKIRLNLGQFAIVKKGGG